MPTIADRKNMSLLHIDREAQTMHANFNGIKLQVLRNDDAGMFYAYISLLNEPVCLDTNSFDYAMYVGLSVLRGDINWIVRLIDREMNKITERGEKRGEDKN